MPSGLGFEPETCSLVHRYYDPTTAQFLSVDPLVAQTGQPFSYAGDDPVNGGDPSGFVTCPSWLPGCGVVTKVQHGVSHYFKNIGHTVTNTAEVVLGITVIVVFDTIATVAFILGLPEDIEGGPFLAAVAGAATVFGLYLIGQGCQIQKKQVAPGPLSIGGNQPSPVA